MFVDNLNYHDYVGFLYDINNIEPMWLFTNQNENGHAGRGFSIAGTFYVNPD